MRRTRQLIVGQGARFTRGYAAVPWCGPARASILTSLHEHNHRCLTNNTHHRFVAQGLQLDTVATRMAAAGYRTGFFGKYLNGMSRSLEYVAPGWDRWVRDVTRSNLFNVDGVLHTDRRSNNDRFGAVRCRSFIRRSAGSPWFAVFAPTAPHDPYTPTAAHAHDYDGVRWDPVAFNEADMSDKPSWLRGIPRQDRARMRRAYEGKLEELQDVDDQVAMLLTTLRETGQLANTFVFLVSDNGYLLGEHRLFKKEQPYEESSGVPFLVRGPGVVPGALRPLVSHVDLMPTTLAVAGLDPDAGRELDGRSLLEPLRTGDWSGWRRRLLVENLHRGWTMLREGDTCFIDHEIRGERELYDLGVDPWQLRNRATTVDTSALQARLAAMRGATGTALRALEVGA
jgi:arylsulfatase A-like enzyme